MSYFDKPIFTFGIKTNNLNATNFKGNNVNVSNAIIASLNAVNLDVNGNTTLNNLDVNGNILLSGNMTLNNLDVSGNATLNNLNVNGNTLLSNLDVSGNTTLNNLTINGKTTLNGNSYISISGDYLQYSNNTQQTSAYTGGTPGTYNNCNMTIDSNGKISSISSGTSNANNIARIFYNVYTSGVYYKLNVTGGPAGLWPQNTFFTIRLTYSINWNFDGSGNSNAQNYAYTSGTYDIYPYRFVENWCIVDFYPPLGNMSTNELNGSTSYGYVDSTPNVAPYGRQFFGYDVLFNTNGPNNNPQVYCSGQTYFLQFQLPNPEGWGTPGYPFNAALTVELLNPGGLYSSISTTGFDVNFNVS